MKNDIYASPSTMAQFDTLLDVLHHGYTNKREKLYIRKMDYLSAWITGCKSVHNFKAANCIMHLG